MPSDEALKIKIALAAVQLVVIDVLTTVHLNATNPGVSARAHREHIRDLIASHGVDRQEDEFGLAGVAIDDLMQATDRLLASVEANVLRRGAMP